MIKALQVVTTDWGPFSCERTIFLLLQLNLQFESCIKLIGMNAAYSDDCLDKLVTISKVHIGLKYKTVIIT
jgi:hypothetical protein